MAAADRLQHVVPQGLRVDAHPGRSGRPDGAQLVHGHGVRPPGLHCVLPQMGEIKAAFHRPEQRRQLLGRQGGRGSAAEIHRLQPQAQRPSNLPGAGDFLRQQLHIPGHQAFCLFHGLGHKGAVIAAGGAEGDGYIQAEAVRPGQIENLVLLGQGLPAERGLLLVHQQRLAEIPQGGLFAVLQNQAAQQLHRPHAGDNPPRLGVPEQPHKQLIQQRRHLKLAGVPIVCAGIIYFGNERLVEIVQPQPADNACGGFTPFQAGFGRHALGFLRPLLHRPDFFLGQKEPADILHFKAVPMPAQP